MFGIEVEIRADGGLLYHKRSPAVEDFEQDFSAGFCIQTNVRALTERVWPNLQPELGRFGFWLEAAAQRAFLDGMPGSIGDDGSVEIKVNCKEDVGKAMGSIRYALAVTLEVAPGINIPIYERVSQRIRQATPVPSR